MTEERTNASTASEQYAQAHSLHYGKRDLASALRAYDELIASHPAAAEAGYARSQQINIVNSVVPSDELLTSQLALALRHLERARSEHDGASGGA